MGGRGHPDGGRSTFSRVVSSGRRDAEWLRAQELSSCSVESLSSDGERRASPSSSSQRTGKSLAKAHAPARIALRYPPQREVAVEMPEAPVQDFPANLHDRIYEPHGFRNCVGVMRVEGIAWTRVARVAG
jgi:hypothetical protein